MAKDATWLVFILIVVLAAWTMQYRQTDGPILSPSGGGSNTTFEQPSSLSTPSNDTRKRRVEISASGASTAVVDKEYITIQNSGEESIMLSGTSLRNKRRESIVIGTDNTGNQIILAPQERAIIATGKSPQAGSFKANMCSGYLAQNKIITPNLSSFCPALGLLDATKNLDSACRSYINSIPSCKFPETIPTNISSSCNEFVQKHAHYQGCVADHKNEKDFDKKEWRIYLNRTNEFWLEENETIELKDASGILIGSLAY